MASRTFVACLVLSLGVGCVSAGRFDKLQAESNASSAEVSRLRDEIAARDAKLRALTAHDSGMQDLVDAQTLVGARLRDELEKLGQDVDALLADTDAKSVAEARARLLELREAQAAAEKRAAIYADLVKRFKKMVDAGEVSVEVRDGRMLVRLSNDVLFDSGRVELKPAGEKALVAVAAVLASIDRQFQVAGHTDDEPIAISPYASNWELSTARALVVARFLIAHQVKPEKLSAAGYGEFDPVTSNATPQGKAKNRRIEIVLQPQLDELVHLPAMMLPK